MKVRPSVKPICEKCRVIKRRGRVMVICQDPNTNKDKADLSCLQLITRQRDAAASIFMIVVSFIRVSYIATQTLWR